MGGDRRRPLSLLPQWPDVALAAGMLGISASVLVTMPAWSPGPGAWLLVAGHAAPVAFRRTSPRAAFAASIAATTVASP